MLVDYLLLQPNILNLMLLYLLKYWYKSKKNNNNLFQNIKLYIYIVVLFKNLRT